jgi:hypothetical protein
MILVERDIPNIKGSRGGFIALIVCLSVLVVGICIAVFILLRDHEPTDEERDVRQQLSRRHREQQSESSSPFTYNPSSTNPPTLTQKIGGIFGMAADDNNRTSKTRSRSGSHRNRAGQGWIQARSGDDWDSDTDRETAARTRGLSGSTPQVAQRDVGEAHGIRLTDRLIPRDGIPLDLPFHPPQTRYSHVDSNSSIHSLYNSASYDLDASSTWKPPASLLAPTRLNTSESLAPSSFSVSPSPTPQRAGSPEPYTSGSTDDVPTDNPHFSTQSGSGSVSVRTFHTGTKFIESLE